MVEAQTNSASFDDMNEYTFRRFGQFAYTGDYCPPPLKLDQVEVSYADTKVTVLSDLEPNRTSLLPDKPLMVDVLEEPLAPPPVPEYELD